MWQKALEKFLDSYTPVQSLTASTDQFTTRQIQGVLHEHTGSQVDAMELYVALVKAGFDYISRGIETEWLLKRKE